MCLDEFKESADARSVLVLHCSKKPTCTFSHGRARVIMSLNSQMTERQHDVQPSNEFHNSKDGSTVKIAMTDHATGISPLEHDTTVPKLPRPFRHPEPAPLMMSMHDLEDFVKVNFSTRGVQKSRGTMLYRLHCVFEFIFSHVNYSLL